MHLRRTDERLDEIAALHAAAEKVGLAGILGDLDRQAEPVRVPGRAVTGGFTWNAHDRTTERWWPQGITTSADADPETEALDGKRLLVTSAYSHLVGGSNHGSRISVVDRDTLRYRNVLLVVPTLGRDETVRLDPLLVHAGGIAWVGPYLHVAGTRRGLFSCRVEDLTRVADGPFGYEYVLPVRFSYDAVTPDGAEQLRYSFLSLDRSGPVPHLVAGEYGKQDMTTRLVRYPLDPETFHLHAESDGSARPVHLDERGVGHMQGATVVGDTYYVTSSRGRWKLGSVFTGEPGAFTEHRQAVPNGPEDIAYWPSEDAFWSLSEYPGRRYVFTMPRSSFD
ncbi:MAG: hypothetical protein J7518_18815 [Nocardioidaceae bacterium]|nr:hypothetical protein [Nocardioidaceae bacterium]